MELSEDLTYFPNILERLKSSYKMAHVYGVIQYPRTGKETNSAHKFLLDTGAAISILNQEFNDFIDETFREVDYVSIQYGGTVKRMRVFEFIIEIQGQPFYSKMAHDETLSLPSLLGQYDFLNNFNHLNLDYKRNNKSKLIWI